MKAKLIVLATVVGLTLTACTPDWATQDQSAVIFRITKVTGKAGGNTSGSGDAFLSDVNPVFNDNATISMSAELKKAGAVITSTANDVLLDRYEVVYFRTDGHNIEGVDVPYRISGPVTGLVAVGATADASIIVVRHTAKLEPPLSNLNRNLTANSAFEFGGQGILTVIAEITVYGRTVAGAAVKDTGRLQITFADFASS